MNRFLAAFTATVLGLLAVSCTGETVDYSEPPVTPPSSPSVEVTELPDDIPDVAPPTTPSAPLSSIPAETIRQFNDFSLNFYLANSKDSHENVCVSPLSVGAVLGMIANGDDGAARDGILSVLGLEESSEGLDDLNAYYRILLSNLPNIEDGIACDVTNTLWCDPTKYRIRKSFMEAIADSYYAYGIGISPNGEAGKNAINEFVGKNTNGLIDNFLKSPLQADLAFLNTIYFKAGWSNGFDISMTSKGKFLSIDGQEKETDFMWRCEMTEYNMTDDGTEAIRLNYGKTGQFSMTCILPSSKVNHIPLDEALSAANLSAIGKNMKEEYMIVRLPKFEVEMNNPNTFDILKDLGLDSTSSVQSPAKFGLITEANDFYLNLFIHATKIKVDENGTEGAAVSLGGMDEAVGPGDANSHIREIVFDRPFIFCIRENTTGTILFIGSVKTFS